ncbi:MAG: hypothetical protein ABI613_10565, partial [Gemmatimonadota bacterium]
RYLHRRNGELASLERQACFWHENTNETKTRIKVFEDRSWRFTTVKKNYEVSEWLWGYRALLPGCCGYTSITEIVRTLVSVGFAFPLFRGALVDTTTVATPLVGNPASLEASWENELRD